MPSSAPRTAARNHPILALRWRSGGCIRYSFFLAQQEVSKEADHVVILDFFGVSNNELASA
jgi:hypothetical protein